MSKPRGFRSTSYGSPDRSDSGKSKSRAVPDLRELLDGQALAGGSRFETGERHLPRKIGKEILTEKGLLETKGYVKPVVKRKEMWKGVDKMTVVEDIRSYLDRSLLKRVDNPPAVDTNPSAPQRRIVRVSGSGDSRKKKLLISKNLRKGAYDEDFDEDTNSKGLPILSKRVARSDVVDDYDKTLPVESLHLHSPFSSETEGRSTRGYKGNPSDFKEFKGNSSDWSQRSGQSLISFERLATRSGLQKQLIGNQGLKDKYDSGLCSDELNHYYGEESQSNVLGDDLAGLIFMCNDRLRINCFHYKVLGMPTSKLKLLDHVKPGTKLFLFEYESRELWGMFEASSYPGVNIEKEAFIGAEIDFPLQVRFSVCKLYDPLPEKLFKEAIKENYFTMKKFHFELNAEQVYKLTQLFCFSGPSVSRASLGNALPQSSVSRGTMYISNYHESGILPDGICDRVSHKEKDVRTRRLNSRGNNSLRKLPIPSSSNFGQSTYGFEAISENLELEDVDGLSSSGDYPSTRDHAISDLTKLKREYLMKDINKLSKDWINPKADIRGEEGVNEHSYNELDLGHLRKKVSYGLEGHLHDDILESHVDNLYLPLNEKDSIGRSSESVPAFSTKGAGPLKVCVQESNRRIVKHVQHAARDLCSPLTYTSLGIPVRGQSADDVRAVHIDLVNARYNARKARENEIGKLNDLKEHLEPSVSSYRDVGSAASVSRDMLENNYRDAERPMIRQKSFLVSTSSEEVHPVHTPNYEFQKFQQPSCTDATGNVTTVKRKLSSFADDDVDCLRTRFFDNLGKINTRVKHDTLWMETLQDKEMHRVDGDERNHFKDNSFVSVSNLKNKPTLKVPTVSPKSSNDVTVSNPFLKAETTETIQQKKPSVWTRLSGRASTTPSSIRSRSRSRSRSLSLEEIKHSDESLSEQDFETEMFMEEDSYDPNDFEVIDSPVEDYVIDFKRRKNIHGGEEQSKSEVAINMSKTPTVQVNNIQSESDAQKKRRRLVRPEIASGDVKSMPVTNAVVEERQNASSTTLD